MRCNVLKTIGQILKNAVVVDEAEKLSRSREVFLEMYYRNPTIIMYSFLDFL